VIRSGRAKALSDNDDKILGITNDRSKICRFLVNNQTRIAFAGIAFACLPLVLVPTCSNDEITRSSPNDIIQKIHKALEAGEVLLRP